MVAASVCPVQAWPGPGMVLIQSSINRPWPRLGLLMAASSHHRCQTEGGGFQRFSNPPPLQLPPTSTGSLTCCSPPLSRLFRQFPSVCRPIRPFPVRLHPCTWIPRVAEPRDRVPKIVFFKGARVPFCSVSWSRPFPVCFVCSNCLEK